MSRAILVLGMHRSGTSALAGVLSKLGVDFGEHLMPASRGENPKGFWEHEDIVAIHEEALGSLGLSWDSLELLEEGWWKKSFFGQFRKKLHAIFERDFSHSRLWGLKDPRLCRLLPLWNGVLRDENVEPHCVIVLRHPKEVAHSLNVRNAMPEITASMLWLEYVLAAERDTRDFPRTFVRYEDLLSDWRSALSPLLKVLEWQGESFAPDFGENIDRFLDSGLRHHEASDVVRGSTAPLLLAQDLYENLQSMLDDRQIEQGFDSTSIKYARYREEMTPWLDCIRNLEMNRQRDLDSLRQDLSGRIKGTERELERIRTSLSWKLSMPVRLIQNSLARPRKTVSEIVRRFGNHGSRSNSSAYPVDEEPSLAGGYAAPTLAKVQIDSLHEYARRISFSCTEPPLVSIVIPVFNNIELTVECLLALAQNTRKRCYEVIVINDASTDDSSMVLPLIEGLVYMENKVNMGYTVSCNRGADVVKGEYIVFLNNDTQVQPGWLESLLAVFDAHDDAGIVGSKLLNEDGSLQEAGAELDEDAVAVLRGKGKDPTLLAFNRLEEVAYVSGASLMIKAELFRKIDGFDRVFTPAYYEDSDLAMRVRQSGYRVYYQPASTVVHHLNATTNQRPLLRANLVARNRQIFLARWKDELLTMQQGTH